MATKIYSDAVSPYAWEPPATSFIQQSPIIKMSELENHEVKSFSIPVSEMIDHSAI